MTPRKNLAGQRFGRLVILGDAAESYISPKGKIKQVCRCRCDCGEETKCLVESLRTGARRSCGCLRREICAKLGAGNKHPPIHGESMRDHFTPEYVSWRAMNQRCTNPKGARWKHYGGRGIQVCEEWQGSYTAFLAYVGRKPSPQHSLDRYPDPDGNYEPGNVRWATPKEQQQNTRKIKRAS